MILAIGCVTAFVIKATAEWEEIVQTYLEGSKNLWFAINICIL